MDAVWFTWCGVSLRAAWEVLGVYYSPGEMCMERSAIIRCCNKQLKGSMGCYIADAVVCEKDISGFFPYIIVTVIKS